MYYLSKLGRSTILACTAFLLISSASAQNMKHSDLLPDDNPYLDDADMKALFEKRPSEQMMQQLQSEMGMFTGGVEPIEENKYPDGVFVFVSTSMGPEAISNALQLAAGQPVSLVFRGIEEGETIMTWTLGIEKIVRDYDADKLPSVLLDPTLFTKHNVTHVPTMILLEGGERISSVSGSYNPDFLFRRQEEGRIGALPPAGNILPIAEPDLLVQMQQKFREYDIEGAKERAVNEYWNKAAFIPLPDALNDEVRWLDPTVVFQEDIITPDQRVIVKAGDAINPLSHLPFHSTIYVFNATDPAHREFVNTHKAKGNGTDILITTQFDRAGSWEGIVDVENQLEAPVYLLSSDIQDRFDVRVIPTIITSAGEQFKISEHAVTQ